MNPTRTQTNLRSIRQPGNTQCYASCIRWNVPFPWDRWKTCARRTWFFRSIRKLDNLSENTLVGKIHDESGSLWSTHTQWKINLLLKKIVTLRYSTRKTSSNVQSTRKTSTSKFQDFHILQWNNFMTSTFEIWFRKSRIFISDIHFKAIFHNVNNSNTSAKNQKTWFAKLGKSNCANYSYKDVDIFYCTCGHFLRDKTEKNKKLIKNTLDFLSIPNYCIKKGRSHGHRYGKKSGDHECFAASSLKKKCKKKHFLDIQDRLLMKSSARTWLNWVAKKNMS